MDFSFIEDEGLRTKAEQAYAAGVKEQENRWNDMLTQKVNEATSGLQAKNTELLAEKKKLQDRFKGITDPEEAMKALQLINENEDVRLIKEGKLDEVIERRTSALRSDFEAKVGELNGSLEEAQKKGKQYEQLFKNKMVEDAIRDAALAAKVEPGALFDVVQRGKQVFTLGEDNNTVEARDANGKLIKLEDGVKILTPSLFVEGLKKTAPHFWPKSVSAGFDVAGANELEDIEHQMNLAADRGDTKTYRALRNKLERLKGKK